MSHFKMGLFLVVSVTSLLFFQNCQNRGFTSELVNGVKLNSLGVQNNLADQDVVTYFDPPPDIKQKAATSLRYFRGGYLASPNLPNWMFDMTINLEPQNDQFLAVAKTVDPYCGASGALTADDVIEITKQIAELKLEMSSGSTLVDGGVETVELTSTDGVQKINLMQEATPKGEMYATNPEALSKLLRAIHDRLPMFCQ